VGPRQLAPGIVGDVVTPLLRPGAVELTGAQLAMAGDQVEIWRQPRFWQIAEQPVDEHCFEPGTIGILPVVTDVSIRGVRRGDAGDVATWKQAENHALDLHALLEQLLLVR
jgi:hypothetical protein